MVLVAENDNSDNVLAEISFDDYISNYEVLVPNSTMELDNKKQEEFFAKFPELAKAFNS
jgi:Tat protein secretion system quality control protein TatD with DNase activity